MDIVQEYADRLVVVLQHPADDPGTTTIIVLIVAAAGLLIALVLIAAALPNRPTTVATEGESPSEDGIANEDDDEVYASSEDAGEYMSE